MRHETRDTRPPGKGKPAFISSAWAVRWAQVVATNPSISICPSPVGSQCPFWMSEGIETRGTRDLKKKHPLSPHTLTDRHRSMEAREARTLAPLHGATHWLRVLGVDANIYCLPPAGVLHSQNKVINAPPTASHKKGAKNYLFYIYDVITWEKEKKSYAIHYLCTGLVFQTPAPTTRKGLTRTANVSVAGSNSILSV